LNTITLISAASSSMFSAKLSPAFVSNSLSFFLHFSPLSPFLVSEFPSFSFDPLFLFEGDRTDSRSDSDSRDRRLLEGDESDLVLDGDLLLDGDLVQLILRR